MGSPASLTLGPASPVEYLHALQEEKRKIEAFKRELPVCMHLIDQAIENARQRATDDQKRTPPVLENFMPLKRRWERLKAEEGEEEVEDHKEVVVGRPAWMGEAQLWTQQHQVHQDSQAGARSSSSSRLLLSSKHRQGGAFVPFNRDRQQLSSSPPPSSTPEAAAAPGHTNGDNNFDTVESVDVNQVSSDRAQRMSVAGAAQPPRKARRCWSPELHRRFVNALQQLGGSQVATPKQIRELMKVDGLTNDEVKSHLQKYRLHTRRPSPSPASSPPPMVILGWVPPECTLSQPAAAPHALQDQYKSTTSAQQQPPKKHSPPDHQHLSPASQTSSLNGPSPGRHSSTDSYVDDEGTDSEVGQDQEMMTKCRSTSSSREEEEEEDEDEEEVEEEHDEMSDGSKADHLRESSRGRSTTSKAVKLQTLRKVTRAAA